MEYSGSECQFHVGTALFACGFQALQGVSFDEACALYHLGGIKTMS